MPNNLSAAEALTFNVAGLLAEPPGTVRELDVSAPPLDLTVELDFELHPELIGEIQEPPKMTSGVEGHLKLTRTNRGLFVRAHMTTAIALSCSRCLRDIEWPVDIDIDEEALPVLDFASGVPIDISAEPDLLRLTDHHELELEGEVRDAVLLAEPIAPLCRPDCPGLCPICGQELGSGPHDHPDEDIDPRLEALKVFRDRPDS